VQLIRRVKTIHTVCINNSLVLKLTTLTVLVSHKTTQLINQIAELGKELTKENNKLLEENAKLLSQIQQLTERNRYLEEEVLRLKALSHPPAAPTYTYAAPSYASSYASPFSVSSFVASPFAVSSYVKRAPHVSDTPMITRTITACFINKLQQGQQLITELKNVLRQQGVELKETSQSESKYIILLCRISGRLDDKFVEDHFHNANNDSIKIVVCVYFKAPNDTTPVAKAFVSQSALEAKKYTIIDTFCDSNDTLYEQTSVAQKLAQLMTQ
jgi:hypothetical protein